MPGNALRSRARPLQIHLCRSVAVAVDREDVEAPTTDSRWARVSITMDEAVVDVNFDTYELHGTSPFFLLYLYKLYQTIPYNALMEKKAYLAGGCFWGLEELFRDRPGVITTEAGYTGGENENPTYENHPGHAEALEITYDSEKTSFKNILDFFFCTHNPTTKNRQGNDVGTSYRSAIFYQNEEEKEEAEKFIAIVNESGRWPDPVVTTLEPFTGFYPAEEYHQDYLQKNPGGYTCHLVYFDSYLS